MLRVVILLACAAVAARAQVQQAEWPPLVNCLSRAFKPKSGICKGIDMSSKSCWPSAKCDVDAKVTKDFIDLDGNRECDSKELFDVFTKTQKDFEALVDSEAWSTPVAGLESMGGNQCKFSFDLLCSISYGLKAKADVCNQGGSACAFFSGSSCTNDASCTTEKKPCCKSLARQIKANLEMVCTGISEKTLKMIDDEVADSRIKKECSDSDCFEQADPAEQKSTKSSASLRMPFAPITAVLSVVLSLVFI